MGKSDFYRLLKRDFPDAFIDDGKWNSLRCRPYNMVAYVDFLGLMHARSIVYTKDGRTIECKGSDIVLKFREILNQFASYKEVLFATDKNEFVPIQKGHVQFDRAKKSPAAIETANVQRRRTRKLRTFLNLFDVDKKTGGDTIDLLWETVCAENYAFFAGDDDGDDFEGSGIDGVFPKIKCGSTPSSSSGNRGGRRTMDHNFYRTDITKREKFERLMKLSYDWAVPEPWEEILSSSTSNGKIGGRDRIMRYLVYSCFYPEKDPLQLAENQTFVIDGHYMEEADIKLLPLFDGKNWRMQNSDMQEEEKVVTEYNHSTPLTFQSTVCEFVHGKSGDDEDNSGGGMTGQHDFKRRTVCVDTNDVYTNNVGEGEYVIFCHLNNHFQKNQKGVPQDERLKRGMIYEVRAADTDVVFYALFFLSKLCLIHVASLETAEEKRHKKMIPEDHLPIIVLNMTLPGQESESKLVDVNELYRLLYHHFERSHYRIASFVIATIAAGGDYTIGYSRVPMDHFYNAYMQHYRMIGKSVFSWKGESIFFDGRFYRRLVAAAFFVKYPKKFEKHSIFKPKDIPDIEEESMSKLEWIHQTLNKDLIAPKYKKFLDLKFFRSVALDVPQNDLKLIITNFSSRMPDEREVRRRWLALVGFVKIMSFVGNNIVDLPDPHTHGYKARDKELPISRSNIVSRASNDWEQRREIWVEVRNREAAKEGRSISSIDIDDNYDSE